MENKKTNITRIYKERINLLLDVTQTINQNHSVDELMQEFEILLREDLGVGRVLVYTLNEEKWSQILRSGINEDAATTIDPERDLKRFDKIENLGLEDENSPLRFFDAVIPLHYNFKLMGYVLVGDNQLGDGVSPTLRNLKYIQILSNMIIVFIENKKMQVRLMKEASVRQELSIASQIQNGLVPSDDELINNGYVKTRSLYRPHLVVGGDYYDVFEFSPYKFGFIIADVSGKGVGAAMLMSNFQATVRSLFTSGVALPRLVQQLNSRLNRNKKNNKFITAFIGRYNALTGRLSYVNAGHLPPMLHTPGGNEIQELEKGCLPLGMLDDIPQIDEGMVKVRKGSRLIAFTDGLIEVDEGTQVRNSFAELRSILWRNTGIDDVINRIDQLARLQQINGFVFDDTSVLVFEFLHNGVLPL